MHHEIQYEVRLLSPREVRCIGDACRHVEACPLASKDDSHRHSWSSIDTVCDVSATPVPILKYHDLETVQSDSAVATDILVDVSPEISSSSQPGYDSFAEPADSGNYCKFYSRGRCLRGDACGFIHSDGTSVDSPRISIRMAID